MRIRIRRAICAVLDVLLNHMIALPLGALLGVILGCGVVAMMPSVRALWVVLVGIMGGGIIGTVLAGVASHKWSASWRLSLSAEALARTEPSRCRTLLDRLGRELKESTGLTMIVLALFGLGLGSIASLIGNFGASLTLWVMVSGALFGVVATLALMFFQTRERPPTPDPAHVSKKPLTGWMVALDREVDVQLARSARDLRGFVSWPRRMLALLIRMLHAVERVCYETYGKPYDDAQRRSDEAKNPDGGHDHRQS